MDYQYQFDQTTVTVRVEAAGGGYRVTVDGRVVEVTHAALEAGELRLTLAGRTLALPVAVDGPQRWVALAGRTYALSVPSAEPRRRRAASAGPKHDALEAPMPGVVRQVLVEAGASVERGQPLLVLEAMKMEIKIAAPHAGRVARLGVQAGETVQRGQLLADIEEVEA